MIILDLDMPIMNGFEACTRIRQAADREGLHQLVHIGKKRALAESSQIADSVKYQDAEEELSKNQRVLIVALSGLITDSVI